MVRFYSMSFKDVMKLPMRTFWFMSASIARVAAEELIDRLEVSNASMDGEAANKMREALDNRRGHPAIKYSTTKILELSAVRDEEGFNELRRMAG